jgi:hypothetical protein
MMSDAIDSGFYPGSALDSTDNILVSRVGVKPTFLKGDRMILWLALGYRLKDPSWKNHC